MKFLIPLISISCILFSCQAQETEAINQDQSAPIISPGKGEVPILATYTVHAPSGLNFRSDPNPKGEILGKFLNGATLDIIARTGNYDEVMDEGKARYGEWLGVRHEGKTVYVFDAYLRPVYTEADFVVPDTPLTYPTLFTLDIHRKEAGKESYFVVMTDGYPWNEHPDSLAIAPEYLGYNVSGAGDEHHYLEGIYRARFLQNMGIEEEDFVFVYNYGQDELYPYPVHSLPLLARITPYGAYQPVEQYVYQIGFSLEEKWTGREKADLHSLAVIGKDSPFLLGHLKPMIWEETEQKVFSYMKVDSAERARWSINAYKPFLTYTFSDAGLSYFIRGGQTKVIDGEGRLLFDGSFHRSEGRSRAPLTLKGQPPSPYGDLPEQWAGRFLKNRPPVMFGFVYVSFGCPGLNILDGLGREVYFSCDNRH